MVGIAVCLEVTNLSVNREQSRDTPVSPQEDAAASAVAGEKTAGIVLIGNELLSGKVQDENGRLLLRELRVLGVDVRELHIVPDDIERISATIADVAGRCDVVFTSGGVGPTHDDMTMPAIAQAFSVEMIFNQALHDHILKTFGKDEQRLEAWLKMAYVPDGCCLVYTSDVVWPVYRMHNVYILPGVPANFRRQFLGIRERFRVGPYHLRTVFFRADEGELAKPLQDVASAFPGVALGSYPVLDVADYRVRVTLEGKARSDLEQAFRMMIKAFSPKQIFKIVDGAWSAGTI